MDNQKNILSMDFANNKDLQALVSGWTVGQEYELTLKLVLNEMTPDGAKFSIKEVTSEDQGGEAKPIEPAGNEPVMMVMNAGSPASSGTPATPAAPYVAP